MKAWGVILVISIGFILTPVGGLIIIDQTVEYEITSVETTIDVDLNTTSAWSTRIFLEVTGTEPLDEFDLTFQTIISESRVSINSTPVPSFTERDGSTTTIQITPLVSLTTNTTAVISITGKVALEFQQVSSGTYQVFYDWRLSSPVENTTVRMELPKGMIIDSNNNQLSIFPNTPSFVSDGKSIIIIWENLDNTDSGVNTRLFVQFYGQSQVITTGSTGNSILSGFLGFLLGLILAITAGIVAYYRFRDYFIRTEERIETKVISTTKPVLLTANEVETLTRIAENDGIEQSSLVEIFNVSKARVSQYLSKFEDLGLIKKKKVGRQNYVFIDSDVDLSAILDT